MKKIFLASLLVFPLLASAALVGKIKREGKVIGFDEKTVTLESSDGSKFTVPRSSIPAEYKIRTHEVVSSYMDAKVVKRKPLAREEN